MKEYGRFEICLVDDRNIPKVKVSFVRKDKMFGFLKPI